MKKIVITGAAGIVGSVLAKGLKANFSIISLDFEQGDLTKLLEVQKAILDDTDVIIHLAWKAEEIYKDGQFDSDNILMTLNVLETAVHKHVHRVILASSVHANEYRSTFSKNKTYKKVPTDNLTSSSLTPLPAWIGTKFAKSIPLDLYDWPTSIYGATKIYLEALGRYYSQYRGLEVVVVRMGGVNPQNSPTARDEVDYDKVFLSHEDLIQKFKEIIGKDRIENNYEMIYAISGK